MLFGKYLPNSSATVSALRVEIQAHLAPLLVASTLWFPPLVCHSDRSATAGAAGYVFSESIDSVKTGGTGGGGGRAVAPALWLPLLSALAMSVSEEESLLGFSRWNSQHGNTVCPDGAVSS